MPVQLFQEAYEALKAGDHETANRKAVAANLKAGFRDVLDEGRVRDIFDPCVDDDVILFAFERADKASDPPDIAAAS